MARAVLFAVGACALGMGEGPSVLAAEQQRADFAAAAQRARRCVVLVESSVRHSGEPDREYRLYNTGFFTDKDGHVLTSAVAVSGSAEVRVRCFDGRSSAARVRALDQPSGLALLDTDFAHTGFLPPSAHGPGPGQWILVPCAQPGTGAGCGLALGVGVVSSTGVSLRLCGVSWHGLVQAEVPPARGAAGAPVLNADGDLVGVVLGAKNRRYHACCYAIPTGPLRPILSELQAGRSRRQGWLGLAVAPSRTGPGLEVQGVLRDSPAARAGIEPGDVLLELDGEALVGSRLLESKVTGASPGETREVILARKDETKTLSVQVGVRPLLISPAVPGSMPGVQHIQRRFRLTRWALPGGDAQSEALLGVQQENLRLQRRIEELERRVRGLERQLDSTQ